MRLLAAVENQPQAIRGTGETRREAGNGKEHGWQQPRAMASEPESSHVDSTAKRRIRLARALVVSCRPKGITNSNRRIRNRTYGGVGGADERLSPLSRSRPSAAGQATRPTSDIIADVKKFLLFCLAAVPDFAQPPASQPAKIQTLIITDQNGHDWRGTTPILRKLLEDTGRFEVRITEEFRGAGPETLAPYDLVIVNYYEK